MHGILSDNSVRCFLDIVNCVPFRSISNDMFKLFKKLFIVKLRRINKYLHLLQRYKMELGP